MSFLNATLLAGVLAASVPIILHLLARQKPERVVFPGVAFLTSRLTHQKSRLKIRRWWLLALRVLAVIAFALVLARPHIDASAASSWTTIAIVGIAALGLIVLASISFSRNLSRGLSWSLLVASVLAMLVFGAGAIGTISSGKTPDLRMDQPAAIAIIIDNSPGSNWKMSDADSPTRLAIATRQANELLERVPSGSRVSVVDRSASPVSFSLDLAAARSRLNQLKPLAVASPIAQRIEAGIDLVRTSELTNRHVIVITDLSESTWLADLPETAESSRLNSAGREGVRVSLLNLGLDESAESFNQFLSLPQLADSTPTANVAIPISVEVGIHSASEQLKKQTATVQLQLFENDPSLPVVRDGETVLPPLRTVDRASVTIEKGRVNEVVLSLPPLPRGTYHAVVELVGEDQFSWDNRRFITVDLPKPPRVLVVGDQPEELGVIASALTAPHEVGDPSAPYAIDKVSYRDLTAVDWEPFDLVILIDPPIRFEPTRAGWIASADGLSSAMLEQLTEKVEGGAGLMLSLGPSSERVEARDESKAVASESISLIPQLVRTWRVPDPGSFWQIDRTRHPIFEPLSRPSTKPNWSDFRIRRYWQVESGDWDVIATMPQPSINDGSRDSSPAVLTRSLGQGRVAVTTTPLPALGRLTRTWNDLFTSGDAWPAFVTVRAMAAWLSGWEPDRTTLLVGQSAVLNGLNSDDATTTWQVFPSGRLPFAPKIQSDVASGKTLTLNDLSTPGTYFLREFGAELTGFPVKGVSANLPTEWSNGKSIDVVQLEKWFGPQDNELSNDPNAWSITDQVDAIALGSTGSGGAISLHGPLMLLVVLLFIGEQLLGNRFYGNGRTTATTRRLSPEAA